MDEERKKCSVTFEDENIHKDEQILHKLSVDRYFNELVLYKYIPAY